MAPPRRPGPRSDDPFENFDARAWLHSFTAAEWWLFVCTLALVFFAILFPLFSGFLPREELIGTEQLREAAGGRYEDVFVLIGGMFFATELVVLPWAPGHPWGVVLKTLGFAAIWIAELLALTFIQIGSIRRTLLEGHDVLLGIWLLVFAVSLPVALVLTIPSVLRIRRDASVTPMA